jgi:Cytochrome bd terminal oxidase subunit II
MQALSLAVHIPLVRFGSRRPVHRWPRDHLPRRALYALRTATAAAREQRIVDTVFGVSSVLTPFALGAAAGGWPRAGCPLATRLAICSRAGLNPTSILVGGLAVATGGYLAAVYLSADARRHGDPEREEAFRRRALVSGVAAGAVALGGIAVLHGDAHRLYHGLVSGDGRPALVVSALAGVATLALVWLRRFEVARFEVARFEVALAVAAIVAGWGLAQSPRFLPGLTVEQATASHDTPVAVVVAVLAGAVILFPSLATLFRLVLRAPLARPTSPGSPWPDSSRAADRRDRARERRRLRRRTPDRGVLLRRLHRTRVPGSGSACRRPHSVWQLLGWSDPSSGIATRAHGPVGRRGGARARFGAAGVRARQESRSDGPKGPTTTAAIPHLVRSTVAWVMAGTGRRTHAAAHSVTIALEGCRQAC